MTAELMKNSDITQAHDVYYGITNTYAYRTPCLCLRVRLRVFGLTLARRSRSPRPSELVSAAAADSGIFHDDHWHDVRHSESGQVRLGVRVSNSMATVTAISESRLPGGPARPKSL